MSGTQIDFSRNELFRAIRKIRTNVYEIPKEFRPYMNVPVRIYMTEKLLKNTEDGAFQQGINVASLPHIVKASITSLM